MQIQGIVRGADAVLVDDMVDTGETLYQPAAQLRAQGAYTVRSCLRILHFIACLPLLGSFYARGGNSHRYYSAAAF